MTTLSKLQQRGFTLNIVDGQLIVTPASRLEDREREAIKRDRQKIVNQLQRAEIYNLILRLDRQPVAPLDKLAEITPTERSALPTIDHDRQRLIVQSAALRVQARQLQGTAAEPHRHVARCFECTHRYTAGNRYQCHQRPEVSLWHPRGGIECTQWEARP